MTAISHLLIFVLGTCLSATSPQDQELPRLERQASVENLRQQVTALSQQNALLQQLSDINSCDYYISIYTGWSDNSGWFVNSGWFDDRKRAIDSVLWKRQLSASRTEYYNLRYYYTVLSQQQQQLVRKLNLCYESLRVFGLTFSTLPPPTTATTLTTGTATITMHTTTKTTPAATSTITATTTPTTTATTTTTTPTPTTETTTPTATTTTTAATTMPTNSTPALVEDPLALTSGTTRLTPAIATEDPDPLG